MKGRKDSRMSEPLLRSRIGRLVITLCVPFAAAPHATTPTFVPTGPMQIARAGHQATLLLDGRVLVTGGYDSAGIAVAQAEIFNPVTETWSVIVRNVVPRMDHAATRLRDGRVLVVGGAASFSSCNPSATAETYAPMTGAWSLTGDLPNAVGRGVIAVVLRDGRVLVSGGTNRCVGVVSTAALFNPSTNTWSPTANMHVPRAFHSAVLLADGRVLVTGGATSTNGVLAAAEVYNPPLATWTEVEGPGTPRGTSCGGYVQTFLSALQNGSVLAAGGISGECGSATSPAIGADLFNPTDSRWSPTGQPELARAFTPATLLPDGKVLVAGGYAASGAAQSSAEFFDAVEGGWNLVGSLHSARASHTATRLANGTVLIAGGSDAVGRIGTAEIYLPEIPYASGPFLAPRGFSDRTGAYFFGRAWAVATNSKGHVFISYTPDSERRIIEWNPSGAPELKKYIQEIGSGLDSFHSVRIDKDDNIWAVSDSTNTIIKFSPAGRVLLQFGGPPTPAGAPETPASGTPTPYLNGPTDVTWDLDGNIFVSDGKRRPRIVKYDAAGHFVKAVGLAGSAPGDMQMPHAIVADANGHVYVADGGNARIQVFDHNLSLLAIYDTVGQPWALCITSGPHPYLYSSSNPDQTDATQGRATGEVYKLELDGTIVGKVGRSDNGLGNFRTLHSIDCRQENEILGTDLVDWVQVIKPQP